MLSQNPCENKAQHHSAWTSG